MIRQQRTRKFNRRISYAQTELARRERYFTTCFETRQPFYSHRRPPMTMSEVNDELRMIYSDERLNRILYDSNPLLSYLLRNVTT